MTPPTGAGAGGPRWRRPLAFGGVGVVLAALLAVVLFAGLGTGSATSPVAATQQQVAEGDIQPGINQATGLLLSLTVLPSPAKTAPNVVLTDQHGRPVSMSALRGKVVVFSANDDQCRDLCTLLANDIVQANADLGSAAKDVVWLSVNANPFYPGVAAVQSWTDQHGLASQTNWEFGTAPAATLARTWSEYGIQVTANRQTRTVEHSTELFFIDPGGHERSVAEFGTAAANTALFAHGLAQMADDLLPPAQQVRVSGPETPAPTAGNASIQAAAPSFSLPFLENGQGTFRLSSTRGRYTVLNFWSSTCTVCKVELPALEAAYRVAGAHVDFVGVDVSDQPAAARALAARAHLTYPLVADADGVASGRERITGLPFTVILDPQGHVVTRHPGGFTTEQVEYLLDNDVPALPQG